MANKTTNYGLTKPLQEEFYDVDVQNANMDIIDSQIKEIDDKVKNLSTDAGDLTGTLSITHGGTGATTASNARSNLGAASASELSSLAISVNNHAAASNPHGITPEKISAAPATHYHNASAINAGTMSTDRLPTVPVSKGGTGATTADKARENLGITPETIGAAKSTHAHSASDITSGTMSSDRLPVVPIAKGGTGASTQAAALAAIAGVSNLPVGTLVAYDNIQDVVTSANDMTTNDFISKLPVDKPIFFTSYANRSYNLTDAPSSNAVFLLFNGGYGLGRVGIWFDLYGGFHVFTNGAWKNFDYSYSNLDMNAGSALATGKLYFVYE